MPNKETPQKNGARTSGKADSPPKFSEDTHKRLRASEELPAEEGGEIRENADEVTSKFAQEVRRDSKSKYATNAESLRNSEVNQPKGGHESGRDGKTRTQL
ncbi:hypothetical protein [Bdellovibrio sp. HCB288]|uniref:hypothetical protein n=1 Tax=Bdellovibrio sp. HCB288 TaxID=3394355 RepID=UPI0039B5F45B